MNTQASNRFATNTTTRPIDRRRVLGFAPGLRMSMNARNSNLSQWSIGQGQLITFNPRVDGYLKEKMRSILKPSGEAVASYDAEEEFSGLHFAEAVAKKFHHGQLDFGFRVLHCLTDLDYNVITGEDDADRYFQTLWPTLTCEMELEQVTYGPAGDLLNFGLPLPCPTCRKAWLESTAAQEAIFSSPLNHNTLEELRLLLLSSCNAGLIYAKTKLGEAKAEVDTPGKGKQRYDDADYHFMQILHKKPEHIEQAEITAESARIQGEAIGASVAKAFTDQREMEEFKAWKAARDQPVSTDSPVAEDAPAEPKKRGNPNWVAKEKTDES